MLTVQSLPGHPPARRHPAALLALLLGCGALTACAVQVTPAAQVTRSRAGHQAAARSRAAGPSLARPTAAGSAAVRSFAPAESIRRPAVTTVEPDTRVPGAGQCPMFPADNIWNTNISKLPVNSRSAAWIRSMQSASTYLHPDFGPNPGGYPYGIPFDVVTNRHRKVAIKFTYASESNKGRYPFGPDTSIEGGKNAGGDRHAVMVNKSTCTLYELWDARYSARRPAAGSGAIWNLRSNALRPAGWTSADAAGLPILPGLLNYSQVESAVRTGRPITHAIRFTVQDTQSAYIWPARHEASSNSSKNLPPMGARFRLKASFSIVRFCNSARTPYCRDAKAILTEMKNYGLIVADNGSNWFFQGSAFPRWPDALVSLLKLIPAREFQAVNESCLMVHRNSGEARARPGCRIG
jgi:hypothetical protein